jgi:hypothetical protein
VLRSSPLRRGGSLHAAQFRDGDQRIQRLKTQSSVER